MNKHTLNIYLIWRLTCSNVKIFLLNCNFHKCNASVVVKYILTLLEHAGKTVSWCRMSCQFSIVFWASCDAANGCRHKKIFNVERFTFPHWINGKMEKHAMGNEPLQAAVQFPFFNYFCQQQELLCLNELYWKPSDCYFLIFNVCCHCW